MRAAARAASPGSRPRAACAILARMTTTRFGYPIEAWEAAKAEVKVLLREHAAERRTITYGRLCGSVHSIRMIPRSRALLGMLHDVCAEEDAARGVMLASLVVSKATGRPGEGYFAFARELGREAVDRESLWHGEIERVFEAYSRADAGEPGEERP